MPFLGILFLVVVLLAFPIKFIHSSNFPIFKKILNKCFLPHCLACGILASNQGSNPPLLHWKHRLSRKHWIVKEVLIFIFPSLITHLQPQWWIKRETESGGQSLHCTFLLSASYCFQSLYLPLGLYIFMSMLTKHFQPWVPCAWPSAKFIACTVQIYRQTEAQGSDATWPKSHSSRSDRSGQLCNTCS